MNPIPTTALPSGAGIPVLGQGTWKMGERSGRRADEIAALRLGFDLGMTLVDTAEMYGNGGAEEVLREALGPQREELFLVSKVLPSNASRTGVARACAASLKRLGTDRIDLYLLHWRGGVPLGETAAAFEALKQEGKILHWGVSNFDAGDMAELAGVMDGGRVETNQVLYNLTSRGIEYDLLPLSAVGKIPVMAYSPIAQGELSSRPELVAIAARHGVTPAQIALAWVLRQPGVVAIPKATAPIHVRQNRQSLDVVLTPADLAELDRAFPPPSRKQPLEMI